MSPKTSANSFAFTCPECGYTSRIERQFIGRKGPCSNCGKRITVTEPAPVVGVAPQGGRRSGAKQAFFVLGIIGGVLLLLVLLGAGIISLTYPAFKAARAKGQSSACSNNMQQIVSALNAYHDEHGSYPPAYTTDENGVRMHSWRVLILPQLGYQSLYENYNFEEPWDSPFNLMLAQQMPAEYGCPADASAANLNETSYMVLVGPETAFPRTATTSRDDITDLHTDTLLVVEVTGMGVGWTQPLDLPADQISWQINGPVGNSVSSAHAAGHVSAGFVDGHSETLYNGTTPQTLHDLSTIAGGEALLARKSEVE